MNSVIIEIRDETCRLTLFFITTLIQYRQINRQKSKLLNHVREQFFVKTLFIKIGLLFLSNVFFIKSVRQENHTILNPLMKKLVKVLKYLFLIFSNRVVKS